MSDRLFIVQSEIVCERGAGGCMKSESIERLLDAMRELFGEHALRTYRDFPQEPSGAGFRVVGIEATFSVL